MPKVWRGADKPHTFKMDEEVKLVERRRPWRESSIRNLRGKRLKVVDIMPVAPGAQKDNAHHQRIKVQIEGGTGYTDWISGAWFGPANKPAPKFEKYRVGSKVEVDIEAVRRDGTRDLRNLIGQELLVTRCKPHNMPGGHPQLVQIRVVNTGERHKDWFSGDWFKLVK